MEEQAPYITGLMCPECGHPISDHRWEDGCMHHDGTKGCRCHAEPSEIERDAWKAEAMAARIFINILEGKTVTQNLSDSYTVYLARKDYVATRFKGE